MNSRLVNARVCFRGLAVLAVVGLFVAAVLPASATTLGGLLPDELAAFAMEADRCDDQVTVQPVPEAGFGPTTYDEIVVGDVAASCAGLPLQLVVYDATGAQLATGTATAASGTTTVAISPAVVFADFEGVAVVIGDLGMVTIPAPIGLTTDVVIDSEFVHGYCADVTMSTTSTIPVVWDAAIDLSTYPLNGVPNSVSEAVWSFDEPVLSAHGLNYNRTITVGNPVMWEFCAARGEPEPPDPENFSYELDIYDDWGAGYCATATVSTTSETPVAWEVVVLLDTPPYTAGNVTSSWVGGWSFEAPELIIWGPAWDPYIQAGDPAVQNFCANR